MDLNDLALHTVGGIGRTGGNAVAGDILSGKTATIDSGKIVGTMPNQGAKILTPSTANVAIPAGYHNGGGYVPGDADLIAANILSGKNIFGVAGSAVDGATMKKYATGSGTIITSSLNFWKVYDGSETIQMNYVTVTGLTFQPRAIVLRRYNDYVSSYRNGCIFMFSVYQGPLPTIRASNNSDVWVDIYLDGTQAYISPTSFRLPCTPGDNNTFQWVAWE